MMKDNTYYILLISKISLCEDKRDLFIHELASFIHDSRGRDPHAFESWHETMWTLSSYEKYYKDDEYLSKFSNVRTNDIWKYASKIDPWVYSDKCNEHKNSISELEKDIKDIIKNI